MSSEVDICNTALNMIGASNIISLTEDSKSARLCNQRYEPTRDSVFRAHPWNCLIKRVELAADTVAPAFEWSYAYTLPSDCLRVLQEQYLDCVFKVEGRKIVTNDSSFRLIYIGRITDPNEYDKLLEDALAQRMAAEMAYPLVASSALSTNMFQMYEMKLKEARFVDATEGMPGSMDQVGDYGSIEANTFISSRF
ncbi:MAG: hypothetical protein ACKVK0_18255 [Pirellulales bacterium]|jgi:hypothetical protein|tara:strand:- start:960 stop:1544 length:585 start_codon:yes stop_codon:yes gene_type:complete